MNAEQTMFYRVLLIAGERTQLDERLTMRLRLCDPIDGLTLELADCMGDDNQTLSILDAHQHTMPTPDEGSVFTMLWQHFGCSQPDLTDREILERINSMLHAAGIINPSVLTLVYDYELMDDGIFTSEQLSRAVCTYMSEHRLIDLFAEITEK